MLKAITSTDTILLNVEDYSITEKYDGLDVLEFSIPITDAGYQSIYEETPILEEQRYLIKAIDAGKTSATVKCQLDLDELRADMHLAYSNGSDTLVSTLEHIIPSGWTVVDKAYLSIRRTVESDAATTYDIIDACRSTYGVVFRFDNQARTITVLEPSQNKPLGAFVTRELNLTELNYMGKSTGFATRLYAYGKDGMSFADINNGCPYVDDHTYTDKVVSAYWKDERYTVAENLLEDAKEKLAAMAVPQRSYTCSVVDLAKTNPGTYNFLTFALYDVVTLIDLEHEARVDHMVMEYKRYPNYPEKNVITLSTVAPSIQNTVANLQEQIEKPTSDFREQLQAVIDSATEAISGQNGGNYRITTNAQGQPNGFVIMDTNDISTAINCMRVNLSGIGFSHNGFNGPYDSAWTLDGTFYADFITAGNLTANLIKSGSIESINGKSKIDLDTGSCQLSGTYESEWVWANGDTGKITVNANGVTFYCNGLHRGSFYQSVSSETVVKSNSYRLHYPNYSGSGEDSQEFAWIDNNGRTSINVNNIIVDNIISDNFFGGIIGFALQSKSSGDVYLEIRANGIAYGVDVWVSDASVKENITPCEASALDVVSSIPVRSFDYKAGGHREFGIIAQELKKVFPAAVMDVGQPDGSTLLQPKSGELVPLLLKAVQELREENRMLREEFEQLKSEVAKCVQ